jgi:DNA-binding transcriptional ArsR family regulator
MPFVVLYDACVLHPAPLRDLLVRLGLTGLVQAKWTEQILEECFRSIAQRHPDLTPQRLERSRRLLSEAIPDCQVTGYEALVEGLTGLPDPDDRHVVAAAIRCGAQAIVTFNLKDFPQTTLARYAIEAQHPDDFVLSLINLDVTAVARALREQAGALKNPPKTVGELLESLRQQGLVRSVARLRESLGS